VIIRDISGLFSTDYFNRKSSNHQFLNVLTANCANGTNARSGAVRTQMTADFFNHGFARIFLSANHQFLGSSVPQCFNRELTRILIA
jgi:hypothetical protein